MINALIKLASLILFKFYGYEALNVFLRNLPSRKINLILRQFGAKIGKNVRIKSPLIIHNADKNKIIYSNLQIGDEVYIGRDCIIDLMGKLKIKNNVTISHRVILNTHIDLRESHILKKKHYPSTVGQITIKKGTYIGSNVTVLQNVIIGSNSVIGAFSLVNGNIKSGFRAFGVPCREDKKLI